MSPWKRLSIAFFALAVCLTLRAWGQEEQYQHAAGSGEKLGHVKFPVSCNDAAQKEFERGVAMLHSFWYEEAEKTFTAVTQADPTCAMGYWGVAMSLYHPIWGEALNAAGLKKGWEVIEKAKAVDPKTPRERDYVAAIESYYKDSDKLDHPARALAYEKAMEKVYLRYPEDREAEVFYALALLSTAPLTDKTYANQKKAMPILEKVLAAEPDHPGVTHYIIHACDSPEMAPLGLAAARRYAKIAPSVPHALHMPSHIFTRLGLWPESIESNTAAVSAARDYATRANFGAWDQQLHAMDYLAYAYLQGAQDLEAKQVLDDLIAIHKVQPENLTSAFAFAAIPARYALERRRWADAAALELQPAWFPWSRYPWPAATFYAAHGLGAARSGRSGDAQKDLERIEAMHKTFADAKQGYWADLVEIMRLEVAAWIARAESKNDEALKLMRSAAELEASTDKHNVTPGPVLPARELLGDLLVELNQPAQALPEYEASLRDAPNRFNSLYGAARSAELSGQREKARTYYAKLVEGSKAADGDRPELRQAKTLLASK
jgi:tetratricopeptide (TPR) repeat protein